VATGKTAQEAYDKACSEADAEYGHQQGYSGAINSTRGFRIIQVPPGVKPAKYAEWCMQGGRDIPVDHRQVEYKDGQKCPQKGCKGTIILKPEDKEMGGHKWQSLKPKCTAGHAVGYSGTGNGLEAKFYYSKAYKIKPELISKIQSDASAIDDKHGPCGCVQLSAGKFLFFGWSPS
jgi:hypothetical protein